MIVNKFGGASIKSSEAIQRMNSICSEFMQHGVIVVSAMGKTTNLLEQLVINYCKETPYDKYRKEFELYHLQIIEKLFLRDNPIFQLFSVLLQELDEKLLKRPGFNFDFEYDQIVSFGELLSTKIVAAYLNQQGKKVTWVDIRNCLKTDSTFREGRVDWELSRKLMVEYFPDADSNLYLTQGFIGSDLNNLTTTLGREGSDFTAAVIANALNAEKVVVWKDVPGILCADPDWIPDTPKIDKLSYSEAVELAFYGARVIHPKTIKPLQNKNIPLQVRSFLNTANQGTLIDSIKNQDTPPVYIKKEQQVLISIKPKDYSFIIEENLSHIFGILAHQQIKVNLMQNSALSFSIAVDSNMERVPKVIQELKLYYNVKYNDGLDLITIRHNQAGAEHKVLEGKTILVEQRSRTVAKFIVR